MTLSVQANNGYTGSLTSVSLPRSLEGFGLSDGLEHMSTRGPGSDGNPSIDASLLPNDTPSMEIESCLTDKNTVDASLQSSQFSALFNPRIQSNTVNDEGDGNSDDTETLFARQWSKHPRDELDAATAEDDTTYALGNIEIIGAERQHKEGDARWWYLTRPHDITFYSQNNHDPMEFESEYGSMEAVITLGNGYHFVCFSPR